MAAETNGLQEGETDKNMNGNTYLISNQALEELESKMKKQMAGWEETFDALKKDLDGIVGMESFQGKAADSVKAYISEVCGLCGAGLRRLMDMMQESLHSCIMDYREIDPSDDARLPQDVMTYYYDAFKDTEEELRKVDRELEDILRDYQDIFAAEKPSFALLEEAYAELYRRMDEKDEEILRYEANGQREAFDRIGEMMYHLEGMINGYLSDGFRVEEYRPGDCLKNAYAAAVRKGLPVMDGEALQKDVKEVGAPHHGKETEESLEDEIETVQIHEVAPHREVFLTAGAANVLEADISAAEAGQITDLQDEACREEDGMAGGLGTRISSSQTVSMDLPGVQRLDDADRLINAAFSYQFLSDMGWSHNAICAFLGNADYESCGINAGKWEYRQNRIGPGYGIVQWTPSSNYTEWACENGYANDSLEGQLIYLDDSMHFGRGQWLPNHEKVPEGYGMAYEDFITSDADVGYLTQVFAYCYERADSYAMEERINYAEEWDEYFKQQ